MSASRTLARKRRTRAGAWGGKSQLQSEGTWFQGREGGQAKRASIGKVRKSMSVLVDPKFLQEYLKVLALL